MNSATNGATLLGCAVARVAASIKRNHRYAALGCGAGLISIPLCCQCRMMFIHVMFEIAARREPAPVTMQAFCALRDKYAIRSSC